MEVKWAGGVYMGQIAGLWTNHDGEGNRYDCMRGFDGDDLTDDSRHVESKPAPAPIGPGPGNVGPVPPHSPDRRLPDQKITAAARMLPSPPLGFCENLSRMTFSNPVEVKLARIKCGLR